MRATNPIVVPNKATIKLSVPPNYGSSYAIGGIGGDWNYNQKIYNLCALANVCLGQYQQDRLAAAFFMFLQALVPTIVHSRLTKLYLYVNSVSLWY